MTAIKAIETRYAGCRFRSRLEARWAVFLDALLIHWVYESEGFELPSGRYLPDFRLPTIQDGCWLEIKGTRPTKVEADLAFELAAATGDMVFIAWGDLPRDPDISGQDPDHGYAGAGVRGINAFWPDHSGDFDYAWCVCPKCGEVGLTFEARGERVCQHRSTINGVDRWGDKGYSGDHPLIRNAFVAARSARFEHGETP